MPNSRRRTFQSIVLTVLLTVGLAAGVNPAQATDEVTLDDLVITADDNVVLQWNAVALQAIRDTAPAPPVAARALAITHTAMFDAWAAYDRKAVGTRLGGSLRRPAAERTTANKSQAVSFGAYRALVDLFPSRAVDFGALMATLGYDPANSSTDVSTPAGIGNTTAAAVLEYRHADGSNQLGDLAPGAYADWTGYVPGQ